MILPTKKNQVVTDIDRMKVLIYGPPKIGKTTFCAQVPGVLFLDTEKGTSHIETMAVPIGTWQDAKDAAIELSKDEAKKVYSTIVIDTADTLFRMCRNHVLKANKLPHESDAEWGKGYDLVKQEFFGFLAFLCSLGYGVWFTSHTVEKKVKIKGVERTVTKASMPRAAEEWVAGACDVIGFIGQGEDEKRILYLTPQSALECGMRGGRKLEDITFTTEQEVYLTLKNKIQQNKKD